MQPGVNNAGADIGNGTVIGSPNDAANTGPGPAQPPKSSGNFFTHLLPTIGSIALPAVAGLLAPETGGLSLLAAAGLSGAGSALGKATENATEGKNPISSDDLTAGLEGAAGAGVGGLAGKAIGKVGELAGNRAEGLVNDAETAAANKATQDADLAKVQANRNNFGGLSKELQANNNLSGNQDLLESFGHDSTDPNAMKNASQAGLFINDIDQNALAAGSPIKTTDLISSHDIASATPEEVRALTSPKVGIIGEDGTVPQTITPQQANSFAQSLNSDIRNMQTLANNARAAGNVSEYKNAQQELQDLQSKYDNVQKLASTPEVNAAIEAKTVTPEEKADLVAKYGQAQADHVENAVNEAKTHQDLVNAKLPFAQMNELSSQALHNAKASATPLNTAAAKADINANAPEEVTPAGNPLTPAKDMHTILGGNGGVVGKALTLGVHAVDNPAVLQTLSRIGALGEKLAPAVGGGVGAANAELQDSTNMGGGMLPAANNQPMTTGAVSSPTGGLSRDDLITLALYSPGAFNSLITPSAAQQQTVSAANTAEGALNSLQAPPSGGIMSQVAAKLGLGGTGEYQRQAENAAQEVAAALPGSNAATIQRELTDYTAGGGSIQDAVRQLLGNLQAVKQNNTNGAYQSLMNYVPAPS